MATSENKFLAERFETWWREFNPTESNSPTSRADFARLRRVGLTATPTGPVPDVTWALTIGAFRTLHRQMPKRVRDAEDFEERLVVAAVALAHVRLDLPVGTTAGLLGGGKDAADRLMAEGRFLRLMRAQTTEDLFDQSRRLVALLKRAAPVGELGASLLVWLVDPGVRRTWARSYYGLNQNEASIDEASPKHSSESGAA